MFFRFNLDFIGVKLWKIATLLLLCIFPFSSSWSNNALKLDTLRLVHKSNTSLNITIDLEKIPSKINYFSIHNPSRLVVDLNSITRSGGIRGVSFLNTPIQKIRTGIHNNSNLRIVIDLDQPAKGKAYINTKNRHNYLIIELWDYKTKALNPFKQDHIPSKLDHPISSPTPTRKHVEPIQNADSELNSEEIIKAYQKADAAVRMKRFKEAFKILTSLAKQGETEAQYRLASFYRNGQGVDNDDKKAYFWIKEAARRDHAKAQYNLGIIYLSGRGVAQNPHLARKWLERAAEQGYKLASKKLELIDTPPQISETEDTDQQLRNIIARNELNGLEKLLRTIKDINTTDKYGSTLLIDAVRQNKPEVVQILLKHNANPNLADEFGDTAIHIATREKKINIINSLLLSRVDINTTDKHGNTPLIISVDKGALDIAKLFIHSGANLTIKNKKGWDALRYARNHNHVEIIDLLEQSGIKDKTITTLSTTKTAKKDIPTGSENGLKNATQKGLYADIPAIVQAAWRGQQSLVQSLLTSDIDINAQDSSGYSALHRAAEEGHVPIINLLIKSGARTDLADNKGNTPLMLAATKAKKEIPISLLTSSKNIDAKNKQGNNALILALKRNNTELVEQLLLFGAEPNVSNSEEKTALVIALSNRNKEATHLLLDAGAQINVKNNFGRTPLWIASAQGETDIVELLVRNRALPTPDNNGDTPLMAAIKNRHIKTARFLLGIHKSIINKKNNSGDNALMLAAASGSQTLVLDILEIGSPLDEQNIVGDTALIIAVRQGYLTIVKQLLSAGANASLRNNHKEWARKIAQDRKRPDIVELIENQDGGWKLFSVF